MLCSSLEHIKVENKVYSVVDNLKQVGWAAKSMLHYCLPL